VPLCDENKYWEWGSGLLAGKLLQFTRSDVAAVSDYVTCL